MNEGPVVTSPPSQGLYDPQNEHDSCGVGFVVDLKGRKSHEHRQEGARGSPEPRAPRRVRLREEHGRRRRDPVAGPPQVPRRGLRRRRASRSRPPASTASAWCSCRPIRAAGPPASTCSRRSSATRGRPSSAGARSRPTTACSARPRGGRSRSSSSSSSAAARRPSRTTTPSSASSTSSAAAPGTRSAASTSPRRRTSTSPACRRAPSSTRGC